LGIGIIATVFTLYKAWGLCWSKENLKKLMNENDKFSEMVRQYDHVKMKDAMIWELPFEQYCVVNAVKGMYIDLILADPFSRVELITSVLVW